MFPRMLRPYGFVNQKPQHIDWGFIRYRLAIPFFLTVRPAQ